MKHERCVGYRSTEASGSRARVALGARAQRSVSQARDADRSSRGRRRQRRWATGRGASALGARIPLLLLTILIALSQGCSNPTASTVPDTHDELGIPYAEVPRLSLAETKVRHDAGTAVFVDVRSQGEYETAHIPDAISLPLANLEVGYQELPRDAEIITYCT